MKYKIEILISEDGIFDIPSNCISISYIPEKIMSPLIHESHTTVRNAYLVILVPV